MTRRWIKTPNGPLIPCKGDRLADRLRAQKVILPTPQVDFSWLHGQESSPLSPESQYQTPDFDVRRIFKAAILILGAGSVGSVLGFVLAFAKLIQYVVDYKKVEPKHMGGRTIFTPDLIGLRKVDALKKKLERDYPGTEVYPLPYNVAEISDAELTRLFQSCWLVFLAIDDPKQILRVSDLAYPIVEIVQVAVHRQARSGHIAISMPLVTPCLRCTLEITSEQDIHRLDGEPANSIDIARVAQEAARVGLDILYSKATGRLITRWDTSKNLIYISNARQQDISPDGPGMHFEASQKRPGCPICNP